VAASPGGYSAAFGLEAVLVSGAALTLWLFRSRLRSPGTQAA
jgi:hypothetical protein